MKKIIAILGLLVASSAYSQTGIDNKIQQIVYKNVDMTKGVEIGKNVDGSPYLVEDFLIGEIEGYPDQYQMRYNAYLDEVQFKMDGALMAFIKDPKYGTIDFAETNQRLKLENYNYDGKKMLGYLFVVSTNDDVTIFRKSSIVFQDYKPAKTSYDVETPANFRRLADVYFIKKGTAEIVELPSSKRKLIDLFPEKKDLIIQYFKDYKGDFSNQNDLNMLAKVL